MLDFLVGFQKSLAIKTFKMIFVIMTHSDYCSCTLQWSISSLTTANAIFLSDYHSLYIWR